VKLPIRVTDYTPASTGDHSNYLTDADGFKIGELYSVADMHQAAFAVNSHAALQSENDALRKLLQSFADTAPTNGDGTCLYCNADVYRNNSIGGHLADCEMTQAHKLLGGNR